jgi:zinc protease
VLAQISANDAAMVFSQIQNISADLRRRAVTQDELDRAKRPEIARLKAVRSTNGFWGFWLDHSNSDPRRLEFARNVLTYYREVSAADVQNAAIAVLRNDTSWEVVYKGRSSGNGQ